MEDSSELRCSKCKKKLKPHELIIPTKSAYDKDSDTTYTKRISGTDERYCIECFKKREESRAEIAPGVYIVGSDDPKKAREIYDKASVEEHTEPTNEMEDAEEEGTQSETEKIILKELHEIGFHPKEQYKISKMTVDFAFLEDKIVIEIDGPHHKTLEQRKADGDRDDVLQSLGWKVRRFTAEESYDEPDVVADKIKRFILRNKA